MNARSAPPSLIGQELTCTRGGRTVFTGLSFDLAAGEAMTITGRNGAGKSTLLRLVCGLLRPEAGSIRFTGATEEKGLPEFCHYAGHADALKPAMTAVENLSFWRDFRSDPGDGPLDALDRLGIVHLADLPAAYLSAGQKRRVALARLFVTRRPIWLLDEPTSALDVRTQALFAAEMERHLSAGGLVLAATHADLGLRQTRTLDLGR
jgi:heme exporter protein A